MDRDEDDNDDPSPALAPTIGLFQQQRDWKDWIIDAIELLLQAFLRYLSAIVDFLDRIISSFEPSGDRRDDGMDERRQQRQRRQQQQQRQQQGRSVWIRVFEWLGSGVRNLLPGFPVLPQDRSSLWMPSVAVLLLCFIFLGFRTGFQLFRIVEVVQEQQEEPERTPSKRLLLPDGRYIAYRELGVSVEKSKHSGLVVRAVAALGQTDIPGLNNSLLEQFKVRLIAYDLPGFGESDPNPNRTFNSSALDMELIANALRLGERFWLLVHPGGGPYAWAAIRYIPKRLSGVVMLAPVGNPSEEEEEDVTDFDAKEGDAMKLSLGWRLLARVPGLDQFFIKKKDVKRRIRKVQKGIYTTVEDKEQVLFEQHEFLTFWEQNLRYTLRDTFTAPTAPAPKAAAPKAAAPRAADRSAFSNLFNIRFRFRFPSIPVGPAFRLVKNFVVWLWPKQTESEPSDDAAAAAAPDAGSSFDTYFTKPPSQTWEAFKLKLVLVVVLLVISFLVLR